MGFNYLFLWKTEEQKVSNKYTANPAQALLTTRVFNSLLPYTASAQDAVGCLSWAVIMPSSLQSRIYLKDMYTVKPHIKTVIFNYSLATLESCQLNIQASPLLRLTVIGFQVKSVYSKRQLVISIIFSRHNIIILIIDCTEGSHLYPIQFSAMNFVLCSLLCTEKHLDVIICLPHKFTSKGNKLHIAPSKHTTCMML